MGASQEALKSRNESMEKTGGGILDHARVYLSGPMDFVASREEEKLYGWRNRISEFLVRMGTTVFDPWNKPMALGMPHYGKEDEFTVNRRDDWTYDDDLSGRRTRAELCSEFWPTLHIDLRMTDLADFLIAYCPTNIYSVGTVHEIATARLQQKPVLLVTPYLDLDTTADALKARLDDLGDADAKALFERMQGETPRRSNKASAPSLWYMAMLEHEDYFFDGFGFEPYRDMMGWDHETVIDTREKAHPPKRPLLPYLEKLNREIPKRYDVELKADVENPEWLIFANTDSVTRPEPAGEE